MSLLQLGLDAHHFEMVKDCKGENVVKYTIGNKWMFFIIIWLHE